MLRGMILTLVVALMLGTAVTAQPKKKATLPVGTWVKGFGKDSVTFIIKKSTMRTELNIGDDSIALDSDIGFSSEDSVLFGRIIKSNDLSGNAPPPGALFSFACEMKDGNLIISDLQPNHPEARDIVEGTYKQKKGQK